MTRTYLDMAREKFRLKDQKVISYGPCQTPTLWFCVQVVIVITLDISIVVVIDVMTVMLLSLITYEPCQAPSDTHSVSV